MVDSFVQVIADQVAKFLAAPIGRQFSYVRNYKTNLDSLKEEAKQLMEERECVDHKVEAAERNREEIEQKVQTWLTNAENIINEAEEIIKDEEKEKSPCFKGLCPNLKTRYPLSKNAEAKVKAIVRLKQEGKFHEVSYRTIPQEIWIPSTKVYESFESRMSTLRDIQNALSDPNINMIGVYGMGGIGKTMLVREIARQAENEKLFDQVVFATVTQIPNIKNIQGEIADKLGLEFREESESGRARKLRERLRKERKILVILDNIWTDVDLDTIGIPFGDDHKGCKVLLTARSQDVLSSKMNCKINFLISILNENEAWVLFKKMVGDHIENLDLQSIAIDVAEKCGGLPIAIVTIARALRDKSISIWKNASQELKKPSKRNFTGVPATVYSSIELSYNHLEDDELRSILLLCSLMGDDLLMLDLLKYSVGLGLLQDIDTMEQARDRLYTLVHKLKASCLLLDGETSEEFSMHDVVRDVALSIASRDQHMYTVRDEVVSIKWPSKDTLENCTAISLPECSISELPEGLECPRIKFLLIQNQDSFVKIPENFFTEIAELRVLDLSGMQLSSLPSSIHLLVNLQTLCLHQCALSDAAIIGELKKLEILSFSGSDIEQLPKEIGQLSSLRLLEQLFANARMEGYK